MADISCVLAGQFILLCEYYTAKRELWQGEKDKKMKKISGSVIAGDEIIHSIAADIRLSAEFIVKLGSFPLHINDAAPSNTNNALLDRLPSDIYD